MIIDKTAPFYTKEERERYLHLERQLAHLINTGKTVDCDQAARFVLDSIGNDSATVDMDAARRNREIALCISDINQLGMEAERRYIDSLQGNIEAIKKDMVEVLEALDPGDINLSLKQPDEKEEFFYWRRVCIIVTPQLNAFTRAGVQLTNNEEYQDAIYNCCLRLRGADKVETPINTEELPQIMVKREYVGIEYPIDKVNTNVWTLLKEADDSGQLELAFATEAKGSGKEATVMYSINFSELEQETGVAISKKLTAYDKRCYIAVNALFNAGHEYITVTQIYNEMGNSGRPGTSAIDKINDSLTKMRGAIIHLDNMKEHETYGKYKHFKYDGSLLPMERVSAIVNGQVAESVIHVFRELPLISFAKDRRQITTVDRKLLESPLSKTEANLQLDDYLIEQISHMKKGKIKNKMLYDTIFKKAGITTRMQRSRAKEKINTFLTHYKKCEFIKGFKESADGITITL